MELGMIIAECPYCGARRFSWGEEDAVAKYRKHLCFATATDKQIHDIVMRVLEEVEGKHE